MNIKYEARDSLLFQVKLEGLKMTKDNELLQQWNFEPLLSHDLQ